jgi:hypothetical protein
MIFCTVSNKKYLLQGIALAYSLHSNANTEYKFYYLCLDDESHQILTNIQTEFDFKIIPIHYSELETTHPELLNLKQTNFSDYCFAFSSLFPKHIFTHFNESSVIYIDSDTYIYSSPQLIYDEIGNKDVGIVRHRHNDRTHYAGEYNVNVVYVKNNINGNKILDWWYNSYMTQTPKELSTCGDQKYLEGFEDIIGKENIVVVDELVGHGAPWNYRLYSYDLFTQNPKKIIWDNKTQVFVFNHFSQFKYDFEKDGFSHTNGFHLGDIMNGEVFKILPLHQMYVEYYHILKDLNTQLNLNIKNNF